MHFPWKKAKSTRISRLVAGLNRTSKRGGPLVVETGFPTSLIDIFVKNRDRLRKSSTRRKSTSGSPQILTLPTHTQSDPTRPQSPDTDARESVSVTEEENYDEKIAFHLLCKILLMVALAVSTQNFTIWIMMAAFLLLLIEYVEPRFLGFWRPESLTPTELKSRTQEELVAEQRGTEFTDPSGGLIELEDGLRVEAIAATKSEPSRSARFKTSLIKKFVPKKLRHRKKKNQEKLEEEKLVVVEENEEQEEDESETEPNIVSTRDQNLQVESEKGNLRKRNSGYSILFIVILAGLVGGRGVALLLTLLCCLMVLIYIGITRKSGSGVRKT